MILVFRRRAQMLTVHTMMGGVQDFPAANNADSKSRGPWPDGEYTATELIEVSGPDGLPEGRFGRWFLRFDVPGRSGMGIHGGREGRPDGKNRSGHEHATLGCIRTTAAAMLAIAAGWTVDGWATLWVHTEREDG